MRAATSSNTSRQPLPMNAKVPGYARGWRSGSALVEAAAGRFGPPERRAVLEATAQPPGRRVVVEAQHGRRDEPGDRSLPPDAVMMCQAGHGDIDPLLRSRPLPPSAGLSALCPEQEHAGRWPPPRRCPRPLRVAAPLLSAPDSATPGLSSFR